MRRLRRFLGGAAAAIALTLVAGPAALAADDGARIDHIEMGEHSLQVLVTVPAAADVDLAKIEATIDGRPTEATAASATSTTAVRRTAILEIDTSRSMKGVRFDAAKAAALQFIDTVPDDVYVGVVGFAGSVQTYVAPTQDHDRARAVIPTLELSVGTLLYDGTTEAVAQAGDEGQRTVLLLSDGTDTSGTLLDPTVAAVKDSGVTLDAVTLDGAEKSVNPLQALSRAGNGRLIAAGAEALARTFSREAEVLARQILVTVPVPGDVSAAEGTLALRLPSSLGELTTDAFTDLPISASPADDVAEAVSGGGFAAPDWVMYAGVLALGVGLIVVLMLLVPTDPGPMSAAQRVSTYTAKTSQATKEKEDVDQLATAKGVAADLLRRNKTLEARITHRLEGAGSELKPAEWLLAHGGIFFLAGVVGLAIGKGNLFIGLVFLVLGAVGPWMYLGFRRSRRRKAFNSGLPDTLQLMSGSLSAGLSLAQSVDTIVREGSEPINSEFRRVLVETRLGVSLEDALEGIAERYDSRDFEWVVMAIKIQRQVGGNLAELLNTVAGTMREREYVRRQVAALAAEGKLSAWVLGLLPPLFMLYLLVANHDYVIVMFQKPLGWLMLAGAATILSVGVFWMSRLIKVEV